MMKGLLLLITVSAVVANSVSCIPYNEVTTLNGPDFFDAFDFWTDPDPTHGFVEYVNQTVASANGLIKMVGDSVYMGADSKNVAPNGRQSVRVTSKEYWASASLTVLDLQHMPGSVCGSWPAFWTLGDNWPTNGEIDIIEGVNNLEVNSMTLHTAPGCTMDGVSRPMAGTSTGTDCNVYDNYNAGCGVQMAKNNSYGDNFNKIGGGFYAMQRSSDGIQIWFFPRNKPYPLDILTDAPNTCQWPRPDALFPFGANCNADFFGPHQIVFDITFCGDYAGSQYVYPVQGCGNDCPGFVANNPHAFNSTYWLINSLRIFSQFS